MVENNMLDQKKKKIDPHLPRLKTPLVSACKQSFAIVVVVVVNGNDNSTPAVLALVLALTSFTVETLLQMFASNISSSVNCLSLASREGSAEGEAPEGPLPLGSMTACAVRFF